jgi:hypothetical protein
MNNKSKGMLLEILGITIIASILLLDEPFDIITFIFAIAVTVVLVIVISRKTATIVEEKS